MAARVSVASRPTRVLAAATALICAVCALLATFSSGRRVPLLPLAMAFNARGFFFPWPQLNQAPFASSNNAITPSIRRRPVDSLLSNARTIPLYSEATALYLAHVTSVSYCQEPHIRNWSCQPCALVPRLDDVQVVADKRESFQGIVGYSALYDSVVVAFRGSMDIRNWIDNFTFNKRRPYKDFPDVKVHQGFYWAYRSVADEVVPAVRKQLEMHPNAPVMVTGHSLGAAVASICAFELEFIEKVTVGALYTFGEPRSGNAEFSGMLHNTSIDMFRMTHFRDIVPHLPPTWVGFEHTTREVFYDQFQSKYTLCDAEISEDPTCSNACSPFGCTSVVDHLTYLNVTMSHLIC